MRRISLTALCLAWLCANGAPWNVVQVVAWAKMFHDYSQVMPAARALRITFDGSAPCELCLITQKAQDAARGQPLRDVALNGGDKILLAAETAALFVVNAPGYSWPGAVDVTGLTRTESVPVPPPRA